ncbi:uncharacterized protein LOC109821260 [Asparagus officinalis]|uniref:uncharacterized protein LOC109821260 n=1 Tax=Asparagus officinalis TaxID=4686 RepID=UPI00098E2800|nr:uncharacterized protein LOC109821260 [Asparagus officinalis]
MRPIALQRYEQAKRRCLELKGTEKPPRRGRNATKESSLIPDLNRRAVIRWENGVPVGAFANAFNNFLAVLARRHDFFNIFLTWKSQRIDALVACWRYICRFFFLDDNICAWTYCFGQINVSFKRWLHFGFIRQSNTEMLENESDDIAKGKEFEMLTFHTLEKMISPIHFYLGKDGINCINFIRGIVIETPGFGNKVLSNNTSYDFSSGIE